VQTLRMIARRSAVFLAPCVGLVLAGCSSSTGQGGIADRLQAAETGRTIFGHVHGLGIDPGSDTLYAATHHGVFRVEGDEAVLVADRAQDTMGFAVVGDGRFLASGHPDPDEDLPPSLGLIESTDAGETWVPLSLFGEADLHSIEQVGDTVYAFDSKSHTLIVSTDNQRWTVITQLLAMRDIAVDVAAPDTVYAVADDGALLRSTNRDEPSPMYGAPSSLAHIDWEPEGPLVAVSFDGAVMVSPDGETSWEEVGTLGTPVEALEASPGRWHAATSDGIYESTDGGVTWELVLEIDV
jgi:hypothetical protein